MSNQEYFKTLELILDNNRERFEQHNTISGHYIDYDTEKKYLGTMIQATFGLPNSISVAPMEYILDAFLDVARIGLSINPKEQLGFMLASILRHCGNCNHNRIISVGCIYLALRTL